jgi:hypothetical protein
MNTQTAHTQGGARVISYDEAKKIRRTIRNPWLTVALDRVMAFSDNAHERRQEFTMTVLEYVHARDNGLLPFRCECGGEVHYRPSTCGYKCVGCNALYRSNRERLSS